MTLISLEQQPSAMGPLLTATVGDLESMMQALSLLSFQFSENAFTLLP